MKCQNRQFTKFISLLKFPGLQYIKETHFHGRSKSTRKADSARKPLCRMGHGVSVPLAGRGRELDQIRSGCQLTWSVVLLLHQQVGEPVAKKPCIYVTEQLAEESKLERAWVHTDKIIKVERKRKQGDERLKRSRTADEPTNVAHDAFRHVVGASVVHWRLQPEMTRQRLLFSTIVIDHYQKKEKRPSTAFEMKMAKFHS